MAITTATPTHNVTGKVASASTRTFTSKAGKALTKTVLTLDNGIDIELDGFGDKVSKYPPGTTVDMGAVQAFGRWQTTGARQPGLPELGGTSAPSPAKPATTTSRGAFPIPGNDYQVSIIRQNSLTNAVATIMPMVGDCDNMDAPEALRALEKVSDQIIRLAYKYAAFSTGNLDTQVLQEVANKALGPSKAE